MTLRWGFLGAGYVASRAMAPAVHRAAGARLQGVASREESRSRELEPVTVFDSYEHLIESADIDAVYISLTNSQHLPWVVAALLAGKHVLCEKPLALNAHEVEVMRAASLSSQRSLVEAVWVRWHPRHRRFADIVRSGALGESVSMESSFTFVSDMADNYRLRPDMGGGALLDVGCYQVHTWLATCVPDVDVRLDDVERVFGPTGVDVTTRVRATVGPSMSATMTCSFVEEQRQTLSAQGDQDFVEMLDGEAFTSWREASSLRFGDRIEEFAPVDAFVAMVEQVSRHFSGVEPALFDLEESTSVARVLDRIAGSVQ